MSSPLTISQLIQHLDYVQRTQGVEPTDLILIVKEASAAVIYAGSTAVVRQDKIGLCKTEDGELVTTGVFTLLEKL
jgi:hypothetical protein